jgi:hypothetical protein
MHAQATRLIIAMREGIARLEAVEVTASCSSQRLPHQLGLPCMAHAAEFSRNVLRAQAGKRPGDPMSMAKDLQSQLTQLQVLFPAAACRNLPCLVLGSLVNNNWQLLTIGLAAYMQRASRELESNWRMQVVRQGPAKRDVWKRWGTSSQHRQRAAT